MKSKPYHFCRTVQYHCWVGLFYTKEKFNIHQTLCELDFNMCQFKRPSRVTELKWHSYGTHDS